MGRTGAKGGARLRRRSDGGEARIGSRLAVLVAGFATSACALWSCTLLTDLGGLDDGKEPAAQPDPSAPRGSDAVAGDETTLLDDSGGVAADAGPYHPKYERALTVTNGAGVALPAQSTQCFNGQLAGDITKTRADLGDVRVFGPTTERARTIDVRGNFVSLCFSLERAIPSNGAETYVIRYGDPNATPPALVESKLFAFWEGFDGTSLDAQRWLVNGAINIAGGMLTLPKGKSAVTTKPAQDGIPEVASLEIRARIVDPTSKGSPDVDGGPDFYWWLGFQRSGDFTAADPWSLFIARSSGSFHAEHKVPTGPCTAGCGSADKTQRTDFRVYRIDRFTSRSELIDDDGTIFVGDGPTGDLALMLRNWLVTSDIIVDWVRARPIVDPLPKLDLGPEEAAP